MNRAQALAAKVEQVVLTAIEDEQIDRSTLRQIVIGPGRLKDVIHVWANDEWDDYGEHSEDAAFAAISNASWLDEVDAVESQAPGATAAPPPADRDAAYRAQEKRRAEGLGLVHPDPAIAASLDAKALALRADMIEALRLVATGGRLGRFSHLVGLFAQQISSSGYADLVAFHHPRGAGTLWPVHAHEEENDVYSWAALVPEGVLLFTPEGDEDSLSGAENDTRARFYRFTDMRFWRVDDGDVWFRKGSELFDTRLSHGHCHEEWGPSFPSQEQVDAALQAHFRTVPQLEFDPLRPPRRSDTAAWQRFVSLFVECGIDDAQVVEGFQKRGDLESAWKLLEVLPAEHPGRGSILAGLAEAYAAAHEWGRALAAYDRMEPRRRARQWRAELDALYALGHHEELITRCAELESEDAEKVDDTLPWKAMALTSLGFASDAVRLLDAPAKDEDNRNDHRCSWARAHALRTSDPAAAAAALWRAFEEGHDRLGYLDRDFADAAPAVKAVADRKRDLARQREVQADLFLGLERRVTPHSHRVEQKEAGAAATDVWAAVQDLERPKKSKGELRSITLVGTEAFASAGEGGYERYDLSDPSKPKALGAFGVPPEGSVSAGVAAGSHFYSVGWKLGLQVFDLSDRAKPKLVGRAPSLTDDSFDDLALGDGFLAVAAREGVHLYDLTDPARPDPVGIVAAPRGKDGANGVVRAMAVRRKHVFVCSTEGLAVADVRDLRAPRPVAFVALPTVRPDELIALDDLLALSNDGVCFVDVKDPANPKVLAHFEGDAANFRCAVRAGDRVFGLSDHRTVVTYDVSNRAEPRHLGIARLRGADGKDQVMGYPMAALFLDGRLAVVDDDSFLTFVRSPKPASTVVDPAPRILATSPRLTAWVEERLAEHAAKDPSFRAGALMLERWSDTLKLTLDAPRSFAGIESGPVLEEPPSFTTGLGELLRRKGETSQLTEADVPKDLSPEEQHRFRELAGAAWEAAIDQALRALVLTKGFREIASGRVHVLSGGGLLRLVATAVDPARPWKPFRRDVPERTVRTLEERLQDYKEWEKLTAKAQVDAGIRDQILALAAKGTSSAIRVAAQLDPEHEPRVIDAFTKALLEGRGDAEALEYLVERKEKPGVRATLEALMDGAATRARQESARGSEIDEREAIRFALEEAQAAIALGKPEDDRVIALLKRMLDHPDNDYGVADLAGELLEKVETRLPELRPHLEGWVKRADEGENRLATIAKHLYRAGAPEPPADLVEQAEREKRDERYHSMKTGIKILDEAEWHESDEPHVARLWTGKRFAERVIACKAKDDRTSPLWDPAWTPEPHPASWNYLLRSAWPHLERAGAVDWLVERLAAPQSGEAHASDRQISLCVLNHFAVENQLEKLVALAEAVLRSPPGTFQGVDEDGDDIDDAKVKERVRDQMLEARVAKGFQLGREGKLADARIQCDAALKEAPNDGGALFLDARLAWLESSPEAGIERAKANLQKTGPRDRKGLGRLNNLIGCALDELRRWDEAVAWFQKAAEVHGDPMYFANLAEVHEKRGVLEEALRYARLAKKKGARSDLVKRLLAENVESDEEEELDDEETVAEDEEG